MDARLRPSGQAGPLVTSIDSFEAYHRGGSEIWERQALVRHRYVAGDPDLGKAAEAMVRRFLYSGPPKQDPRPEIHRMRERIEREVGRVAEGREDLKAGYGGIMDVEFAVQALQLIHGWRSEELQTPNTLAALAALRQKGLLAAKEGAALMKGYHFLRRIEARLRILHERPTDALPRDSSKLDDMARGLGYTGDGGTCLLRHLREQRARVREAYEAVILGERS
jgi:glutamate-ammonia-ligase adenylyltransferase